MEQAQDNKVFTVETDLNLNQNTQDNNGIPGNADEDVPLIKPKIDREAVIGVLFAFISSVLFTICGLLLQKFSLNVSDVIVVRYSLQIVVVISVIHIKRYRSRENADTNEMTLETIIKPDTITKLLMFQGRGILNGWKYWFCVILQSHKISRMNFIEMKTKLTKLYIKLRN